MKSIFAIALMVVGSLSARAEVTGWDLMHTKPECSNPGKPDTWCTQEDRKEVAEKSGMEERVAKMISRAKNPKTARIFIAYFSFSNSASFKALCERGKLGVKIEGFFDNDYSADSNNYPNRLMSECQGPSGENVKVLFLGQKLKTPGGSLKVWRLHHNKFLMVDPGNGEDININFSSGNLSSSGLSLHFDHWAMLTVTKDSSVYRYHECVVRSLNTAMADGANEIDDPVKYRMTLDSCLVKNKVITNVEAALKAEQIAPLFSPNPQNQIYTELKKAISSVGKGGRIYGAIQHFLHNGIASDLRAAVNRGVKVQLIMDDDIITGDSEVPGVRQFYDNVLSKTGIEIKFLQTNASVMQMMHNKFIVLQGVNSGGKKVNRVFSGAGHFTTSALKNNYENFYLTQNDTLTKKYQDLFNYMWPRAVTEEEIE